MEVDLLNYYRRAVEAKRSPDVFLPAGTDGRYVVWSYGPHGGIVISAPSVDQVIVKHCGKWRISVDLPQDKMVVHYEKSDLSEIERWQRREPRWQREGNSLFTTCICCGSIHDDSRSNIGVKGGVFGCIVCSRCHVHVYAHLDGFTADDYEWIRYRRNRERRMA